MNRRIESLKDSLRDRLREWLGIERKYKQLQRLHLSQKDWMEEDRERIQDLEEQVEILTDAVRRLSEAHRLDGGDKGQAGHTASEQAKEVEALINGSWKKIEDKEPVGEYTK